MNKSSNIDISCGESAEIPNESNKCDDFNKTTIALYKSDGKSVPVEVHYMNETFWLTQQEMANLFGCSSDNISLHLKNIYASKELDEISTTEKISTVQQEGTRAIQRKRNFYNLDAIIAVGYRVNSLKATRFRQWATTTLKEYIKKGFVLDDERLKSGPNEFDKDYFRELLERIHSIRASERRIWQQITDIFAECSIDYDKDSAITHAFYANVQNKFHYAITGQTAAEIIYEKADASKENMGLTTWKNAPHGRILKSDVSIAKNYLDEKQIRRLERAVSGFFDYIEDLVERGNAFTMDEFVKSVNEFLEFRRYDILDGHGLVSASNAKKKAESEYDEYNRTQPIESDFDREVKRLLGGDCDE